MEVTFKGPEFDGMDDENLFFESMHQLPGFVNITGHGFELTLRLDDKAKHEQIVKLTEIFRKWKIDSSQLESQFG